MEKGEVTARGYQSSVRLEVAGLGLEVLGQVRQGVPLPFALFRGDSTGEGHGLVADAADRVGVVDGKLENFPHLIVVDRLDDGGHQDDAQTRDPGVFHRFLLQLPQAGQPPGFLVDLVAGPVELQVHGVEPGLLGLPGEFQVFGHPDAVGSNLQVGETHGAARLQDVQEARVDGGLPPGKLHRRRKEGLHVAHHFHHFHNLLISGLVYVALHVGIGKADGAAQVAPVGQVDIGQDGRG